MFVALVSMAAAAFLAATPLPLPSEPVFVALQAAGAAPLWLLVAVASVANTAGSILTWAMGWGLRGLWAGQKPAPQKLVRAEEWFRHWGRWSLLLSWAPLGDALCFLAGAARLPVWQFTLIVGVAKTGRYLVLAGLVGSISAFAAST